MTYFSHRQFTLKALLAISCTLPLAGCEQLGIEDPVKTAARKEAEGRAIGSACRHSGRALEECYALNKKASKADIFSGWRDMDAYMRENKIDVIPPTVEATPAAKPTEEHPPTDKEGNAEEAAPAQKDKATHSSADVPPSPPVPGIRTT